MGLPNVDAIEVCGGGVLKVYSMKKDCGPRTNFKITHHLAFSYAQRLKLCAEAVDILFTLLVHPAS